MITTTAKIALAGRDKDIIGQWVEVTRVGFLSTFNHTFEALGEQVEVYYVLCDDGSEHRFPHPVVLAPDDKFRVVTGQRQTL